jgi:hypothetical protein
MVDPDSPSGSEYQIPLEGARDDAAPGGSKPKRPGERSAPLFGEGLKKRGGDDSGQASDEDADYGDTAVAAGGSDDDGGSGNGRDDAAAAAKARADRRASRRAARRDGDGSPETVGAQATAATTDGGSDGLPLVLSLGAFALLLGGGVGYVLRRRSARPVDDAAG